MRIVRHGPGWDIAFDMVFTDQKTAAIIAKRIQSSVHALLRDAVDANMCVHNIAEDVSGKTVSSTVQATTPQPVSARVPQHAR